MAACRFPGHCEYTVYEMFITQLIFQAENSRKALIAKRNFYFAFGRWTILLSQELVVQSDVQQICLKGSQIWNRKYKVGPYQL